MRSLFALVLHPAFFANGSISRHFCQAVTVLIPVMQKLSRLLKVSSEKAKILTCKTNLISIFNLIKSWNSFHFADELMVRNYDQWPHKILRWISLFSVLIVLSKGHFFFSLSHFFFFTNKHLQVYCEVGRCRLELNPVETKEYMAL